MKDKKENDNYSFFLDKKVKVLVSGRNRLLTYSGTCIFYDNTMLVLTSIRFGRTVLYASSIKTIQEDLSEKCQELDE